MIPTRSQRPFLAAAFLLAAPALLVAQETKKIEEGAERDRFEGMITKIERLGDEDSNRYRLTINTGVPWRDYARNVAKPDGAGKAPDDDSVAEGQPETESSVVHVEVDLKTPIQHRYRAEQDERSLGGASAQAAFEVAEADPAKGDGEVPDGRQGKSLQPQLLDVDQFVVVKARGEGDNPKVEWVVRLEPVRKAKDD